MKQTSQRSLLFRQNVNRTEAEWRNSAGTDPKRLWYNTNLMATQCKNRRALVLGRGASGEAAAEELRRRGYDVEFAENLALVVASPGVPVKSELQLGCEELKRRGWKLLAVTGSKGKSSVVKVVADALSLAGLKAVPCGNYGRPVCDLIGEDPGWAVVEASSFQLETTQLANGLFEASAVLNVQEDHLDRHGDVSVYHSLKHRLTSLSKYEPATSDASSTRNGPRPS